MLCSTSIIPGIIFDDTNIYHLMINHIRHTVCGKCYKLYSRCIVCSNDFLSSDTKNVFLIFNNNNINLVCFLCRPFAIKCTLCEKYSLHCVNNICNECISYIKFSNVIKLVDKPNNKHWLGNRYISFELEIINKKKVNLLELPEEWFYCRDSSLSSDGIELINHVPLCGESAVNAINKIYQFFKTKYYTDNTCGYHIHLDCTQETEETIKKFVKFCIQIQDSVLYLVSENRVRQFLRLYHTYCKKLPPFDDNQTLEDYINKKLGNARQDEKYKYATKYHLSRYHWWNFHSYFYRMTIECRLHQGTLYPSQILNWAELWIKLFEFVKTTPESNYKQYTDILEVAKLAGVRTSSIKSFLSKRNKNVNNFK